MAPREVEGGLRWCGVRGPECVHTQQTHVQSEAMAMNIKRLRLTQGVRLRQTSTHNLKPWDQCRGSQLRPLDRGAKAPPAAP